MSKTLGERLADLNIEVGTAITIDWEQVRIQAAIAVMQGITPEWGNNAKQYAEWAVQVADALIAELQKKQD
jgi:hypothetical protein